jgi:hypothetical protein
VKKASASVAPLKKKKKAASKKKKKKKKSKAPSQKPKLVELPKQCPLCQKKFKQPTGLEYHLNSRTCRKRLTEPIGPTLAAEVARVQQQLASNHKPARSKLISSKQKSNDITYKCEKCHRDFTSLGGLKYHKKQNVCQKPARQPFSCIECGEMIDSRYHLAKHKCSEKIVEKQKRKKEKKNVKQAKASKPAKKTNKTVKTSETKTTKTLQTTKISKKGKTSTSSSSSSSSSSSLTSSSREGRLLARLQEQVQPATWNAPLSLGSLRTTPSFDGDEWNLRDGSMKAIDTTNHDVLETLLISRMNQDTTIVHLNRSLKEERTTLSKTGAASTLHSGTRALLNVGDDVGAMSWAPSSPSSLAHTLAVCTRKGPLKDYVQLWSVGFANGSVNTKLADCRLSALLHRASSVSVGSGSGSGSGEEGCKGYVMHMHWVPSSSAEEDEHGVSSSSKSGSKRKRPASSSSSSSSTSSISPSSSLTRTGLLCTVSSFGACHIHIVPILSNTSTDTISLLQRGTPVFTLADRDVLCLSFSKARSNVVLLGKSSGIVEMWCLNTSFSVSSDGAGAVLLKTFDHMYKCRHVLDDSRHGIAAIDWSPHDRHRFVSGT